MASGSLSIAELHKLRTGDKIDALDKMGKWGKASVLEVTAKGLMIHFLGFRSCFDELITWREHPRICVTGAKVRL